MPRGVPNSGLSIAQLEKILTQKKSLLKKLEKKRATAAKKLAAIDAQIAAAGGGAGGRALTPTGRVRNEKSLVEYVKDILQKGGAMRVSDIADAVKMAGYQSNSPEFRGIVNQALIKNRKVFVQKSRGMYQLK